MSARNADHPEYVLGHSTGELDRLIEQAAFYGDLTEHTLRRAGVTSGMRILDLGCGAGDVSFLAASLVGPSGSVVGVDLNADAIALATSRAASAGVTNVTFQQADITQLPYQAEFDAVIGRLVILYLGDPVAGVRQFARYARRGGILHFQEFCPPGIGAEPSVPMYTECMRLINETFARANINLYTGMQLPRIYREAGLAAPHLLGMARVETGETSGAYVYLANTVRSLMPLIERMGVATAAEVGIDTMAERLRAESLERHAVLHLPELISAWVRVD